MNRDHVLMGVVGRPHGVRGLVHVHSYTAVPEDLATYDGLVDDQGRPWRLSWHGTGIARLHDAAGQAIDSREAARQLVNRRLYVPRASLPAPDEDEFYFADLVGLEAREQGTDRVLGRVGAVHDYGAGTSLEINGAGGSLLLPFTRACVPVVNVRGGWIDICLPDEIEVPVTCFPGTAGQESAP
ncbi:16S rRNA processing protein RimM [Komagataeibacter rhaeticus]|uniref:ribosome maturation factor RimM n=2 Tax=Komagataeibacter rhaeticus TaxID=215221 RepID=UPI0004D93A35|nr:ribosome maturation factor RimM [Komagataeibacter rhaeticus]KDU95664.1 ribosome maturation protein RimM [Komagataeibacter rhaeticus AF1]MBL7239456.1 16S rRNA processing protein RimM [Komagataeibacter rhaeticus]PYD54544.1 16S rRNA processing protein RimM [Komagataeibacter rhaeticus]GBQ15695.1 ribosomal RNA small subunit 16S rRNA processing protein RimM [Komagataeibacter rhaeticus DSM 16663]